MSLLTSKLTLSVLGLISILVLLYVFGKKSVHHEITIPASPKSVWQVLVATERYPEWNPVMVSAKGRLQPGQQVQYTFRQEADKEYVIPATVKTIEEEKLLNQVGGTAGILTYDHRYSLEKVEGGTKVVIHEEYRGIAVPFWNPAPVADAYQRLNEALRARTIEVARNE